MIEGSLAARWTKEAHLREGERNTCIELPCKTKTIEGPTTQIHPEEKENQT